MVDIRGQILKRRRIQNRPTALAVMDCGDVIISPRDDDSRSVGRLLRDGTEQHVYDTSPSYSYGVSVTTYQEILICTFDGRIVRINGDGSNARLIYKGSGDKSAADAIENKYGNVFISENEKNSVMIFGKDGIILSSKTHTIDGSEMQRPAGLAVDKLGNVLCGDIIKDCVYIIDHNHQMRELIGRSGGIQRPGWMVVDSDNNLWITQSDGNIIVVKYLSQ